MGNVGGVLSMVLAAALNQTRNPFNGIELANPNAPAHVEIYLFATHYPNYAERMAVIALMAKVHLGWDMPHLKLV